MSLLCYLTYATRNKLYEERNKMALRILECDKCGNDCKYDKDGNLYCEYCKKKREEKYNVDFCGDGK